MEGDNSKTPKKKRRTMVEEFPLTPTPIVSLNVSKIKIKIKSITECGSKTKHYNARCSQSSQERPN